MKDKITVSKEEIEEIKKEYYEKHTYIGTNKPVTLSDFEAEVIIKSRKGFELWKNSYHKSHKMSDWHTEVKSPCGTPRFYSCRKCLKCGYEQYYHSAGRFIDSELLEECLLREEE